MKAVRLIVLLAVGGAASLSALGCEAANSTLTVNPTSWSYSSKGSKAFVISVDGSAKPKIYEENLSDSSHFRFTGGSENCLTEITSSKPCTEEVELYSYASGLKATFEVVPQVGTPKIVTLTTP